MIPVRQLEEYVSGRMSGEARARFEETLAADPDAIRQILAQEKLDAGLRMLLCRPGRDRIRASIFAVLRNEATTRVKADVLRDVRSAQPPPDSTGGFSLFAWIRGVCAARPFAAWAAGLSVACAAVWMLMSLLPIAVGTGDPASGASEGVAQLVDLRGRISVTRAGVNLEGVEQLALHSGDSLRADSGASGVVRLHDGTRVALEGGAALVLGGEEGKELTLAAGRVVAEVAKQPAGRHVVLRTALATVTVHGTALALEATAGATRLDVREGRVRMAHAERDSALDLTGGEFALAVPGQELVGGVQAVPPAPEVSPGGSGDRDPSLWPFLSASPWNTAIGSGAVFNPVRSPGLDLTGRGLVLLPAAHDRAVHVSGTGDPLVPILDRYQGDEWMRLRLPTDALRNSSRLQNCTVIDPLLGVAHELVLARRSGDAVDAMLLHSQPLRGSGIPPEQVGHTLSGLPLMAGVIRTGELRRGIRHALAASVLHHGISRTGTAGQPFVWPACRVPMETRKLEALAPSGNVHFGTLLAIPPEVDISALGLAPGSAAFEVARALQDYGTYVTHSYTRAPNDGQGWTQPHLQLFAEGVSETELRSLHAVVSKLAGHLQVVANNSPATPAGGGKPRREPAPDLAAPSAAQVP